MPTTAYWRSVPHWYIAGTTGDNANKGDDPARKVKTASEVMRRLQMPTWQIDHQVDITYLEDAAAADPYLIVNGTFMRSGLLRVLGTMTTIWDSTAHGSAGFTSVDNTDETVSPNGQYGAVADTSLSNTWTALGLFNANYRLRLTTGPNAGAVARLIADEQSIANRRVAVTPWIVPSTAVPVPTTYTYVNAAVGNQYVVEHETSVPYVQLAANLPNDPAVATGTAFILLKDLDLEGPGFENACRGFGSPIALCCNLDGYTSRGASSFAAYGCRGSNSAVQGGFHLMSGCYLKGQQLASTGTIRLLDNTIFYGGTGTLARHGGTIQIEKAGFVKSTVDGIRADDGVVRVGNNASSSPGIMWGYGNAGYGYRGAGGSRLRYVSGSTMKLTGASGDRILGQIQSSWTDGPASDDDMDARVVIA